MISVFKRTQKLLSKAINFYKTNGAMSTFFEIRKRILRRETQPYSYQYLVDKFPQKFGKNVRQTRGLSNKQKIAVDTSAQFAIQNLLERINISADPSNIILKMKSVLDTNQYFRIIDNLFLLEQFLEETKERETSPIILASALPDTSSKRTRRHILFITSQFPNPHNGGGNRVLNFIKILSENNDVYLSSCYIPEEDEGALQIITPYCRSIQKIPLWKFGNNQAEIHAWLKNIPIDIVHYEWPRSLENYDSSYGKYQIFTFMEAASLRTIMDMEKMDVNSDDWLHKLAELIFTLKIELLDGSKPDTRIAVTQKDGDFFRSLYPYQEYIILNHGVPFDEFSLPDIEPKHHTLVFVGNYQHLPNVEAMLYFFQEVWPAILREVPDTRIYIVGPKPPQNLDAFADEKQVIVTGQVDDIRPYIQEASICIAPLITGAGLRGKVVDYASLRRTFVATSIATTGLAFRDGIDYLCADTPKEFVRNIVLLLNNEELTKKMSASAYETAQQNYDTRRLTNFLSNIYEHIERKNNYK